MSLLGWACSPSPPRWVPPTRLPPTPHLRANWAVLEEFEFFTGVVLLRSSAPQWLMGLPKTKIVFPVLVAASVSCATGLNAFSRNSLSVPFSSQCLFHPPPPSPQGMSSVSKTHAGMRFLPGLRTWFIVRFLLYNLLACVSQLCLSQTLWNRHATVHCRCTPAALKLERAPQSPGGLIIYNRGFWAPLPAFLCQPI